MGENVTKLKRNVKVSRLYPEQFLSGTPLQNFSSGDARKSRYFVVNLADSLRVALLYKYGGIYVDLDMIAKKNDRNLSEEKTQKVHFVMNFIFRFLL